MRGVDEPSGPWGRRGRRDLALVVLACAAAAGTALYAASRTWLTQTVDRAAPIPDTTMPVTGGALAPALPALALVALACAGALVATRGRARAGVGVLLMLCGGGVATLAGHPLVTGDGVAVAAAVVSAVAGGVIAALGVLTLRRGRTWSGLGARYESPHDSRPKSRRESPNEARDGSPAPAAPEGSPVSMWDAVDRGEDPTMPTPMMPTPTTRVDQAAPR